MSKIESQCWKERLSLGFLSHWELAFLPLGLSPGFSGSLWFNESVASWDQGSSDRTAETLSTLSAGAQGLGAALRSMRLAPALAYRKVWKMWKVLVLFVCLLINGSHLLVLRDHSWLCWIQGSVLSGLGVPYELLGIKPRWNVLPTVLVCSGPGRCDKWAEPTLFWCQLSEMLQGSVRLTSRQTESETNSQQNCPRSQAKHLWQATEQKLWHDIEV